MRATLPVVIAFAAALSAGACAADAPPPPGGDELCGSRPGGRRGEVEILRFESSSAGVRVQIHRAYEGAGVGLSTIYRLEQWSMVRDGETVCLDDEAVLDYENSHHNWRDRATATDGSLRYVLAIDFNLGASPGWSITLSGQDLSGSKVFDDVTMITTGGPTLCWECPGFVPVFISEILVVNGSSITDEQSEREPWIELYNPSSENIDLAGWFLSDDLADRNKWALPNIEILRAETRLLFADGQPEQGVLHAPFTLATKGALVLTAPDGRTNGGFTYGAQTEDVSFGYSFSDEAYGPMAAPTPGEPPLDE